MIQASVRILAAGLGALILVATPARAQEAGESDRVTAAIARLRSAADFRVRTQAALALGASGDKRAVSGLCGGLDDISTTVRTASATALGRLALGGEDCLKERLDEEKNPSVTATIKQAIARIAAGAGPVITESTRYYVAIGETTDRTGREGDGVHAAVRQAMLASAASLEKFAVAPDGETKEAAAKVLAKHPRLTGFFLWPKVHEPVYAGGNLTVKVEVSIFTYPGKALKGVVPMKLTMPDVQPGDTGSEDDLIEMAAGRAFENFSQHAARMQ